MILEHIDLDELKSFEKFISFPMILFDETNVFYVNESFNTLCGQYDELFTHDPRVIFAVKTALHSNEEVHLEIDLQHEDGSKHWVEMIGKAVHYRGNIVILASLRDITEEMKVKQDLLRISRLRMLMLEITQSVLESEDLEQLFNLILQNALKALTNGALGTILMKERGYFSVASFIGYDENIKEFKLPIEDAFLYTYTEGMMDRIVRIPDLVAVSKHYLYRTVFGEEKYIKSTIAAPIYIKGSLFGIISVDAIETNAFDEDDEKSMEFIRNTIEISLANHLSYQEKAFLARFDRLTKLYNRAYFEEQFELVRELAHRYNDTFNLVMFDMDNLKRINDDHGHLVGDRAIQSVAQELEANVRSSDFLARFGGDEFVGIFYHTDYEKLDEKFRGLLEKLRIDPLIIDGENISCSFSYGIADFPKDGATMNELIKVADDRMYLFKGHSKREQE